MAGNDPNRTATDTEPPSMNAFTLLGNDIRVEVLRVLGDAYVEGDSSRLSFSEIRSRTDTDDPGQLTYHLRKLVGYLVTKTDSGYALRSEGIRLYESMRAGMFDQPREDEPRSVDAGFDCHYCQTPIEATFTAERADIECPECGFIYVRAPNELPLDVFEDASALFAHFGKYMHYKTLSFARGVCTTCGSAVGTEFYAPEELSFTMAQHQDKVLIDRSCEYCGAPFFLSVRTAVLADTGLVAFCFDHGVDILSTPYWELEFVWTDEYVTVRSTDPWEVALQVTFDGETIELLVDGDLNVVERDRFDASTAPRPSAAGVERGGVPAVGSGEAGDDVGLADNDGCLEALRRYRWSGGVRCPYCGNYDTIRDGTTGRGAQRYRCRDCDRGFNDLTGTIFADRGLSLPEMFHIVREVDVTTTARIARRLDRSYNAVLDFVHDVKDARVDDTTFDFSDGWTADEVCWPAGADDVK